MRKLVLLVPIIMFAVGGYFLRARAIPPIETPVTHDDTVLGTTSTPSPVVDFISTPFVLGEEVSLISNYSELKTSEEIQKQYNCSYLVNAGFYTTESTPVGLFKTNGITLRGSHESSLFDGFVTLNDLRTPRITRTLPTDNLVFALQTGPILFENGTIAKLSIKNDKLARRMVALVSGENTIGFLMVQSSYLESLPSIVSKWATDNQLKIADAINLDGGSASAFRGPQVVFPEISPIGSAFCIKSAQ